jgi:hypothetical protein
MSATPVAAIGDIAASTDGYVLLASLSVASNGAASVCQDPNEGRYKMFNQATGQHNWTVASVSVVSGASTYTLLKEVK